MSTTPSPSSLPLHATKMLFLVNHGLQTPLAAIRWGTGRLQRTGTLTDAQKQIVDAIQNEGRLLSKMFDWLLLLAKTDDGVHVPDVQDVFVCDFLTQCAEVPLPRALELEVDCVKDIQLQIDRTLFEATVHALVFAISIDSDTKMLPIAVAVQRAPDQCVVTFKATLTLTLLEEEQTGQPVRRIAGGVSGFLLAVASSFAASLGGRIDHDTAADTVSNLTLRLPLHPPLSTLSAPAVVA